MFLSSTSASSSQYPLPKYAKTKYIADAIQDIKDSYGCWTVTDVMIQKSAVEVNNWEVSLNPSWFLRSLQRVWHHRAFIFQIKNQLEEMYVLAELNSDTGIMVQESYSLTELLEKRRYQINLQKYRPKEGVLCEDILEVVESFTLKKYSLLNNNCMTLSEHLRKKFTKTN